jgi:hypothetical protein
MVVGFQDLGVNYAAPGAHASNSLPHHRHSSVKEDEAKNAKEKINDLILTKLVQQVRLISEYFRRQEEEMDVSSFKKSFKPPFV